MNSGEEPPSNSDPQEDPQPSSDGADRPLIVSSDTLFQGRSEIWIEHRDQMYRLRITSSGKLYLTK